ncbi:mechanosensitive ion channel family protein [Aliamphritea spongicola]|nr:mechanosensitive ion channel family protein [Aliamphritea spongicola]
MDQTTVGAMGKLLRASIFVTSALVVLQSFGYSISGVLAFGGIGGLAIGFAAKDLLANFFGGLMIYLDRPFKVGDWIRSPDQEIEGTVEDIGWRQTCIRTFDKRPLYVPNATFTNISVENPSRMTNRRIYENIGLRYEDAPKVAAVIADIKAMLQQHPDIDANQTLIVNLNSFGASSLDFFIYTFTRTTDWVQYHEIKQDVLSRVIDIVQSNEADFAFPTQTVHIPDAVRLAEASGPE